AAMALPAWRQHLGTVDPAGMTSFGALARLPVLRKAHLPAMQKADAPFAGLVASDPAIFGRYFTSPGPIFEPERRGEDVWHAARAMFAAGFRTGDVVLNTFSYHLTPGGFIMDSGIRAVGGIAIPAGPGQTEQQLDVIEHLRPVAYTGTPDFLKIILDKAAELGRDVSSITKALVSGAAFPLSLRDELLRRGVAAYQAFAVADFGVIAYETPARDGLVVSEDVILEVVRVGTGDPVAIGEVGEIVITSLDPRHPVIRLALGDLTAVMDTPSPCGRTNLRIKGWMGRADQTAKIKGMFVRPEQVADIARRHPAIAKLRIVVRRDNEQDVMIVMAEAATPDDRLGATVREITKLGAAIEWHPIGALPNDGKVIADERPIG
ncbi:MAG: phenylacetate--CoA ligase family protein, partial [Hyphomicrobiales bacterium]|nr:phenylacetate--CoA ligase family protein [Hyphomicrobiales bacterium]